METPPPPNAVSLECIFQHTSLWSTQTFRPQKPYSRRVPALGTQWEHQQSFSADIFQAFANPEDALRHGGLQYCRSDQDVDRCLRQVLLDLSLAMVCPLQAQL